MPSHPIPLSASHPVLPYSFGPGRVGSKPQTHPKLPFGWLLSRVQSGMMSLSKNTPVLVILQARYHFPVSQVRPKPAFFSKLLIPKQRFWYVVPSWTPMGWRDIRGGGGGGALTGYVLRA